MLSRHANNLYWMSRQIERAENTARLLDITHQMSLLPYRVIDAAQSWAEPWALPLVINGLASDFYKKHSSAPNADSVMRFMIIDHTNPSSIYSLVQAARENGRSMRGVMTTEMYEDLNTLWLELSSRCQYALNNDGLNDLFEWIKTRSHQFRGVTFGTMLRDEAHQFIQLGAYMERADNTARLLDVKYHTLLPSTAEIGGAVDYYQWSALLRSVSALSSYRRIYRDVIIPIRVSELLILRPDLPRSLHACMNTIYEILSQLCTDEKKEAERIAGEMHAQLHYGQIDQIISGGLHEYLLSFLKKLYTLHDEINQHFLAPNTNYADNSLFLHQRLPRAA